MSTNDLQALFANLRPKSRDPSSSGPPPSSSAFGLNPSQSPPPFSTAGLRTDANNMSSNGPANAASAKSLLNLLNFGAGAQSTANGTAAPPPTAEGSTKADTARNVSASDLVARLISPPADGSSQPTYTPKLEDLGGGGPSSEAGKATDPAQEALLKLLSKTQPTRSSRAVSTEMHRSDSDQRMSTASRGSSRKPASNQPDSNEDKPAQENKPLFTYQNPFQQLNPSRGQTPKVNTAPAKPAESPIFKGVSDIPQPSIENPATIQRTQSPGEYSTRKKLTPRSVSARALARESSVRSNGTPEPVIKEGTPPVTMEDLPIRSNIGSSGDGAIDSMLPQARDAVPAEAPAKESPQNGADEWEDAEESPTAEYEPRKIPVYNFPIKPFVSITLQLQKPSDVEIREDGVMEISRLKKDFDQVDRSLATATSKYIAYALVSNGGMRIIRQDDGTARKVFKHSHDRVFNVTFCTTALSSPASDDQAVLGTGVSGTVYYAIVSKEANDLFEKNELDLESLSFPPWPPVDENTAGGALKTRAKRSSRHPEYFAIGRGKSIHLIWPAFSMLSRYGVTEANREVDMEKLYSDRNLQISTGKAGKDFAFSEDDTLIVSLDKTGRLRFWDIRELTNEANATTSRVDPIKVDMPLLSLSTASPAEKSWPTSVLFVDKSRPYSRGGALRYVLVGLRQNHTLQLWDIALGKAVQELNFPHENETDGVCSVNYHPGSGIIVVGHPTRNSLFFIHLSAPRYALSSSVTQAVYLQRVAAKDPEVPKPDSTACMSGVREISFASKGQLRSVELLPIHKSAGSTQKSDERTGLFELYAVHSKGVTCLTITREDLGWDANNRVIHGVDAAQEGVVDLKELKLGSIIEETISKEPPEEAAPPPSASAGKKKKAKKMQPTVEEAGENSPEYQRTPAVGSYASELMKRYGTGEGESSARIDTGKKSKKKAAQTADPAPSAKTPPRTASPEKVDPITPSDQLQPSEPTPQSSVLDSNDMAASSGEKVSVGISGDWLNKEVKKIEQAVSREFKKEIGNLYANIQNDRIAQDSTSSARQEAVLRLVSTTLTNNVEKTMGHIINGQIQQVVLPMISTVTSNAIQAQVGDTVAKTLHHYMPQQLNTQLPAAITSALSNPQLGRAIYDNVSYKVAEQVKSQIIEMTNKHIIPTFNNVAVSAAREAANKVEAHLMGELRSLQAERRQDATRMEKFGQIVQGMSETLHTMSETQISFQNQISQERQALVLASGSDHSQQASLAPSPAPGPIQRPRPANVKSKEQLEREEILDLMSQGQYEKASIMWLQSTPAEQVALFDNLFVRFTPEYLATDVSNLVAFSVGITVSSSLQTNRAQRLEWILVAFNAVNLRDSEINDLADYAPALLGTLIQRLEGLYMTIAEQNTSDPVLRQIPAVAKKARDMRAVMTELVGGARA